MGEGCTYQMNSSCLSMPAKCRTIDRTPHPPHHKGIENSLQQVLLGVLCDCMNVGSSRSNAGEHPSAGMTLFYCFHAQPIYDCSLPVGWQSVWQLPD